MEVEAQGLRNLEWESDNNRFLGRHNTVNPPHVERIQENLFVSGYCYAAF